MRPTLPYNVSKFIRDYVEETKEDSLTTSIDVPIENCIRQRQMFFGMYSVVNSEYTVQFEVSYHDEKYSVSSTDEEGTVHDFEM